MDGSPCVLLIALIVVNRRGRLTRLLGLMVEVSTATELFRSALGAVLRLSIVFLVLDTLFGVLRDFRGLSVG